jgi:hypothetical protein
MVGVAGRGRDLTDEHERRACSGTRLTCPWRTLVKRHARCVGACVSCRLRSDPSALLCGSTAIFSGVDVGGLAGCRNEKTRL